jgi:hypothetical protein
VQIGSVDLDEVRDTAGPMPRSAIALAARLADAECFVGAEELVPAGLDVAEFATADVVGQMLGVNLDPYAVGWEQVCLQSAR